MGLASLIDQSCCGWWLRPLAEPRFAFLETVREYALERLEASGEEEVIRHAHAGCFHALAERAESELTGPDQTAGSTGSRSNMTICGRRWDGRERRHRRRAGSG